MSWVPRVVAPAIRAFRQLALRRSARTVAKQVVQSVPRLRSRFQKAKAKANPKKSLPSVGPMLYRRRRFPLRRRRYARRFKKTANKIHTFVRWCDKDTTYGDYGPNTITETGADQHLTYQFKLNNVTGLSDFTNLYDGYKINKIQLMLEPTFDQTQFSASLPLFSRKIRVVHDYNDAFQLTGEDDYLEYGNCKSYSPFGRYGIRITLYPKLNNIIENVSGSSNGYTSLNSNRQFLNIATNEVPHFGLKMFIPSGLTTSENAVMFRVRAKMWLSMRGTK